MARPNVIHNPQKILSRIYRRVKIEPNGCHTWKGHLHHGYGQIRCEGPMWMVHRVVWTIQKGPIPHHLVTDHLCRNRACCNIAHMELVTDQENIRRGDAGKFWSSKTHCPHGHPYSGDNLVIMNQANGRFRKRICRACYNALRRRQNKIKRQKRKAERLFT